MTREDKELLLKDLCARLPYGVKLDTLEGPQELNTRWLAINMCNIASPYLPYLFPLSSMTAEQLKEMQEIIGNPNEACISVNTSGLELWLNSIDTDPTIWLDTIFEVQNWLNKNHFDYRGLIEKGLALDATNLNIY